MKGIIKFVAVLFGLVGVVMVVFLVGMRTKNPAVVDTVRRFNRAVANPRQLRSAGTPGAYASIIHHVGRSSGRAYETPIGAMPVDDGFVVALPYGRRADWLQNVLAAGRATLVHDGATVEVVEPEVVPTESVIDALPTGERRTLGLFGVDECLRLHVPAA